MTAPGRRAALAAALLALALCAETAAPAPARPRSTPDIYWMGLGLGSGTLGSRDLESGGFGHFAALASGFRQRGTRVLGLRAGSYDGAGGADAWDVGALYGVATPPGRWHALVAAGLGFSSHSIAGAAGEDPARRSGPCFPLQAEVTWRPSYLFGLGGFACASLKSGESAAALGVLVQTGRLR